MSPQNTAFVFNKLDIQAELPFELSENCWLSKATADQLTYIKKYLKQLSSVMDPYIRYEYEAVPQPDQQGYRMAHLSEEKWRYYVVSTPADGFSNTVLHRIAAISEVPLDLEALTLLEPYGNWMHKPTAIMRYMVAPENVHPLVVSTPMLCELRALVHLATELSAGNEGEFEFPEIPKALEMFNASMQLCHHRDAQCLALFSIIEMLLTHMSAAIVN